MIKLILAFFGYVKVPKAAVELSMMQEDFIKLIIKNISGEKKVTYFKNKLEVQQALTNFLRSGKILN